MAGVVLFVLSSRAELAAALALANVLVGPCWTVVAMRLARAELKGPFWARFASAQTLLVGVPPLLTGQAVRSCASRVFAERALPAVGFAGAL